MVFVTEIRNPFDPVRSRVTEIKKPGGALASYIPAPYDEAVVSYNGVIVYDYDIIVEDDSQIIVSPVLKGGGGGKNILRTIAFVALAVAAPMLAGTFFAAGTPGYAMVMAGTVLVGGLIINAVLPPQMPELSTPRSFEQSATYGWSGAKTLPRPGAPIPVLYGQMRMPGSVVSQHIREEGDDEYLYMLIALCEGVIEPVSINDILINNNEAVDFDNVLYAYREGTRDQYLTVDQMEYEEWHDGRFIGWFDKVYTANPFSVEAPHNIPVKRQTLGNVVNEIIVSIAFPYGLYHVNDNGSLTDNTVELQIEYRLDGETDWTTLKNKGYQVSELQYEWYRFNNYTYERETTWSTTQPPNDDPVAFGDWRKTGKSKKVVTNVTEEDTFTITASKSATIRREFKIENLSPGSYEVRVTKLSEDQSSTRDRNTMYWNGLTEAAYGRLYYPGIALVGLKIKATGQLSGNAPNLSVLARRADIDVYDGGGYFYKTVRSDNPAWVAWDIITNKQYGLAKEYSRVDFDAFSEWAGWCDEMVPDGFGNLEPRAKFNGVIDVRTNAWEALQRVCSVGRATPVLIGTKYSVVVDKPKDPVQLFTMGNIVEGTYKTSYISKTDLATTIDVEYIDALADYSKQIMTVSLGDDIGIKTSISSIGTTSQAQAYRLARYMLQCNDKQRRIVEFEAGIDSIACQLGDVIMFAHDVPAWGYSGRIVSATHDTVTFDRKIRIDGAKNYSVIVRFKNDVIDKRDIVNPGDGEYDTFTVATQFSQVPEKFDIYTFGEVNKEYLELRVANISRKSDQTRKITALDYNESILDDWQIPQPISRPGHIKGFPRLTNISIGEHLELRNDGTVIPFLDFSWGVDGDSFAIVDIYVSRDNVTWSKIAGDIRGISYQHNAVSLSEGQLYYFAFPVSDLSGRQSLKSAAKMTHTYLGKSAPPGDVQGFAYEITSNGLLLTWDKNTDVDLSGYTIYFDGAIIQEDIQATSLLVADITEGEHIFEIYAVDTSGNESANPNPLVVDIVLPSISQIRAEIIDNNVLLRWDVSLGTVPIATYIIERDGEVYGTKKGTFTVVFEPQSGTFTYCITPIDIFGNAGGTRCVTATVEQSPDFVLIGDWYSDFGGTKTNAVVADGRLYSPVVDETYQEHFDNNGWASPQDQVDDGFPIWSQPFGSSGSYEETIDLGAVIAASKITVTTTTKEIIGLTISETCTISISEDGTNWTDYPDQWDVYGQNFQYVKIKLDYAGGDGYNVLETSILNVKLHLKTITDEGLANCLASDPSGTFVTFDAPFTNVQTIILTPSGTTPVTAVYDFVDELNPTGFSIYLYDTNGNRTDGKCSWFAKGY